MYEELNYLMDDIFGEEREELECPSCGGDGTYCVDGFDPGSYYGHYQTEEMCETCEGAGYLDVHPVLVALIRSYGGSDEEDLLNRMENALGALCEAFEYVKGNEECAFLDVCFNALLRSNLK